jgi:hypothetical protein
MAEAIATGATGVLDRGRGLRVLATRRLSIMQNKDMMYAVLICIASVMCVDRIGKSMAPTGYPKIANEKKRKLDGYCVPFCRPCGASR